MPSLRLNASLGAISSLTAVARPLRPSIDALHHLRSLNSRSSVLTIFKRNATHQSEGRANGPKNSPGKRLGAKKTGEEYVIPGNIIFKQRGSLWHAGENCAMARDHSIYAIQPGFVKYYRDPQRNPKKRYIGVVFERNMTLPTPLNAARRRRLGMYATKRTEVDDEEGWGDSEMLDGGLVFPLQKGVVDGEGERTMDLPSKRVRVKERAKRPAKAEGLKMRADYSWRQSNWEIGRIPETEGHAQKVIKYNPKDRFAIWRRRTEKRAAAAEKRNLSAAVKGGKGKKKGSKKPRKR